MSKLLAVIAIVLLAFTAVGTWSILFLENERMNLELRQMEAQRQAVLESQGIAAWRQATRYETFGRILETSPQEPKRNDTFTERSVWIKSFQKGDIKFAGNSKKYGSAAYLISSIVAINDKPSQGFIEYLLKRNAPFETIHGATLGDWHVLLMQCRAELLDGGDWIASEFKFSPLADKPDFPFERIKDE